MLYKFKSQAAADVIMLEFNGDQMLTIVGKVPSPQGIITVDQIPAAISALEAAFVVHEEAESKRFVKPGLTVEVEGDSVMLRHRAEPFVDLLRTSAKAGKDVVWGGMNFHRPVRGDRETLLKSRTPHETDFAG